jgi:hypothetical protein
MKRKEINKSLYEDKHPQFSTKGTGYKDKQKALDTLTYQKQVVNTMYNRAKYHPNQTKNMKEAMKIFNIWLKKHS